MSRNPEEFNFDVIVQRREKTANFVYDRMRGIVCSGKGVERRARIRTDDRVMYSTFFNVAEGRVDSSELSGINRVKIRKAISACRIVCYERSSRATVAAGTISINKKMIGMPVAKFCKFCMNLNRQKTLFWRCKKENYVKWGVAPKGAELGNRKDWYKSVIKFFLGSLNSHADCGVSALGRREDTVCREVCKCKVSGLFGT